MADFYEDFKNNINNRPEPDFNSEDWANMDARLDARPRRVVPLFWWSTAALLLLLLGSNIWWFSQNQYGQNETFNNTKTVIIKDTIYQKEIIYRIDTVVQIQRIVESKIIASAAPNAPFYSQSFTSNGLFSNNENKYLTQKSAFTQKGFSANDLLNRAVSGLQKSNTNLNEAQLAFTLPGVGTKRSTLDFLATDLNALATEKFTLSDDIQGLPLLEKEKYRRRVLRKVWRGMQPTGLTLGLASSFSILFDEEIVSQKIRGLGLTAAVEFSPGFRLWFAGNHESFDYKSNAAGDRYDIPVIALPSTEFTFKYAEVSRSAVNFATGLQYYFNTDKKLNPYVGIGIGGRFLTAGNVKYEFENGNTEIDEYRDIAQRAYRFEYLDFQAGIAYQWSDRWQTQLGVDFLRNREESAFSTLRFQAGVGYHF